MAYYSTIIAADGKPLRLCIPGPGIPSSLDTLEYVNPRTNQKERLGGDGSTAWVGNPDDPCDPEAIPATIVRR